MHPLGVDRGGCPTLGTLGLLGGTGRGKGLVAGEAHPIPVADRCQAVQASPCVRVRVTRHGHSPSDDPVREHNILPLGARLSCPSVRNPLAAAPVGTSRHGPLGAWEHTRDRRWGPDHASAAHPAALGVAPVCCVIPAVHTEGAFRAKALYAVSCPDSRQ